MVLTSMDDLDVHKLKANGTLNRPKSSGKKTKTKYIIKPEDRQILHNHCRLANISK